MCTEAEKIEKIKKYDALVFRKKSFYVGTAIVLLSMFVSIVMSFNTNVIGTKQNTKNIQVNCEEIEHIKERLSVLDRIEYNLKSLCEKNQVKYIE